jgi:hypothetical protein
MMLRNQFGLRHRHHLSLQTVNLFAAWYKMFSNLVHTTTHREPLATVTTTPLDTVIGPADMPDVPAAIV